MKEKEGVQRRIEEKDGYRDGGRGGREEEMGSSD